MAEQGTFAGQVVVITGAAGNIGRGVVQKFAAEGAKLVFVDLHQDSIDGLVNDMGAALGAYLGIPTDIGQPEQVQAAIQQIDAKFGRIDHLAHIAGGFAMGQPVHEAGIDVFEKMMYLNARLTWVMCGHVAKYMVDKGTKGTISAIIARPSQGAFKNGAAYAASKAAAERIIQTMGQELLDHDIRVNGVSPSVVDTEPNRNAMPNADFSKWVTAEHIADTLAFLASDAASAISGVTIGVYNKV
jgi:NAD(P)-dependent dehydrogenase (short-subunit alcohol dehydrogenase family)